MLAPRPLAPLFAAVLTAACLLWAVPASATTWAAALGSGSHGESQAKPAPSPPATVSTVCVAPATERVVTVSWTAVTDATTYSIFKSTSTSTGSYSSTATGLTGTSWESGTLATGNVWFEVEAFVGTNWVSAKSSASNETTLASSNPECKVP